MGARRAAQNLPFTDLSTPIWTQNKLQGPQIPKQVFRITYPGCRADYTLEYGFQSPRLFSAVPSEEFLEEELLNHLNPLSREESCFISVSGDETYAEDWAYWRYQKYGQECTMYTIYLSETEPTMFNARTLIDALDIDESRLGRPPGEFNDEYLIYDQIPLEAPVICRHIGESLCRPYCTTPAWFKESEKIDTHFTDVNSVLASFEMREKIVLANRTTYWSELNELHRPKAAYYVVKNSLPTKWHLYARDICLGIPPTEEFAHMLLHHLEGNLFPDCFLVLYTNKQRALDLGEAWSARSRYMIGHTIYTVDLTAVKSAVFRASNVVARINNISFRPLPQQKDEEVYLICNKIPQAAVIDGKAALSHLSGT